MPTIELFIFRTQGNNGFVFPFYYPGTLSFGTYGTSERAAWLRYIEAPIEQGSIINSANLVFTGRYGESTAVELLIYGNASDNAAVPNDEGDYLNKVKTVAQVPWNFSTTWTNGVVFTSPDISIIIQEIVNRPGWINGNNIQFFIRNASINENRRRGTYTYPNDPSKAPKLIIDYTLPVYLKHTRTIGIGIGARHTIRRGAL